MSDGIVPPDLQDRAERHTAGIRAARKVAAYHIGDSAWADVIVAAYLDPENALAALRREMSDDPNPD